MYCQINQNNIKKSKRDRTIKNYKVIIQRGVSDKNDMKELISIFSEHIYLKLKQNKRELIASQ